MASLIIMNDSPKVNITLRYVNNNAPPPFMPTIYGNRYILPIPTAEPIVAKINPKGESH